MLKIDMKKFNTGFTLIELLVVIAILGILVMIGLNNFVSSQRRSRDMRRKSDLRSISVALETYYADNNAYPTNTADGKINGCSGACTWGNQWKVSITIYMQKLSSDPISGHNYYYQADTTASHKWYQLYAYLENPQDPDISSTVVSKGLDCGGSTICNYGIASQNTTPR